MPSPLTSVPCAIITVSDRCAAGQRDDLSGPVIALAFADAGADVRTSIVIDGATSVENALRAAIAGGARVVVTTGGTGIAPRDQTPEGTRTVLTTEVPGIAELLRRAGADAAPGAALSRGLAGIVAGRPSVVVVNVAGSAGAAADAALILPGVLAHALAQLDGGDH